MYSKIHNIIVDLIVYKVYFQNKTSNDVTDTILKPAYFRSELELFDHLRKGPNITMIDEGTKQVTWIETSVPYDVFTKHTHTK